MNRLSLDTLLSIARTQLTTNYINKWKVDITNQPKLRTYRLIKQQYKCENYVSMYLPRHLRSFVAQIRCGVLPLHIETGRFRHLKLEERLCKVCNLIDNIETEFHFLFCCPAYMNLRLTFYNKIFKIIPTFASLSDGEKLSTMLTDKRLIFKSALYIQDCFMLRTSKLFI